MDSDRNTKILYWHYIKQKSQADIGRMFGGITRQRVNHIVQNYKKHLPLETAQKHL